MRDFRKTLFLALVFSSSNLLAQPVQYAGTGNFYDEISGARSSTEADAHAQAQTFNGTPGHLATLTSAGENEFVKTTFGTNA